MRPNLWMKILIAAAGLGVAVVSAYFVVPGSVDRESLGYSVSKAAGGATLLAGGSATCEARNAAGSEWTCFAPDPSTSGGVYYRVTTTEGSCWVGERPAKRGRSSESNDWPEDIEGCVKVADNLRVGNRLIDF